MLRSRKQQKDLVIYSNSFVHRAAQQVRAIFAALALGGFGLTVAHAQIPVPLADINTGAANNSTPQHFVELGGKLYFTAIAPGSTVRRQLYSYDPSRAAGSQLVQVSNFNQAVTSTNPNWLRVLGTKLVMVANNSANGPELWEYDPASNTFVEMPTNGTATAAPINLLVHEGKLFYSGNNGERTAGGNGTQLYVYDPALPKKPLTDASPNPRRLTDLNTSYDASSFTTGCSPSNLVGLPGRVLFSAALSFSGNNGGGISSPDNRELAVWNIAAGTVSTFDLAQGFDVASFNGLSYNEYVDSNPLQFRDVVNGTLYFSATITVAPHANSSTRRGPVLMKFNPATMATPALVKELNPDQGSSAAGDNILGVIAVGTKIYYAASDGGTTTGQELYVCDTATDVVTLAKDFTTGATDGLSVTSTPAFALFGGKLYLMASGGSHGLEPWQFDPATSTAIELADINTAGNSGAGGFFPFDGKLYFRAAGTSVGTELFAYDPASGSTSLVADLAAGTAAGASGFNSPSTSQFPTVAVYRGSLFYQGNNGSTGTSVGTEPFVIAPLVSMSASPASASENSGTATTWTITRSGSTTNAITVNFSVGGTATYASDYTQSGATTFGATSGTVAIAAGQSSASFTTTPSVDALGSEADETIAITVVSVTSPSGTTAADASAAMTIVNVAGPPPAPEIAIEAPVGSGLADGASSIAFGHVLVNSSSAAKTFTIKNTGNANLTGLAVTKDGSNSNDFAVTTSGMATTLAPDASTTFTVTFTPAAGGARSAALHIASNDSDENPFDIALTGTANSRPVANAASPATNEDNAVAITLSGTDAENQSLTYTVVTDPAHGSLSGTAPNLTYTPAANANGADSFTFKVNDGTIDSAPATISITIGAVNDAPTFSASNPPDGVSNEGAQSVTGWASFNAGSPNESSQNVLAYSVSGVSNPALFSAGPVVANDGTLSYTPAANAGGSSTFEVQVQDNGGVANGGVDLSGMQTFTVTVNRAPAITSADNATFAVGSAGTFTITTTGFPGAALSETGTLPEGVTLNGKTGVLSGTPAPDTEGVYQLVLEASNGVGTPATQAFTLTVNGLSCLAAQEGMIMWLPGDGNGADLLGGNHATLQNDAQFAAGKVGQAFTFANLANASTGQHAHVSTPTALPLGAEARTIELWFRTASDLSTSTEAALIQYGAPAIEQTFGLVTSAQAPGKLYFNGGGDDLAGTTTLEPNTWYHAAVSYDGATVKLYLNGQLESSKATALLNTTLDGNGLTIGSRPNTSVWNGQIDEIGLFNRALSLAEIQAIYYAGAKGKCAPELSLTNAVSRKTHSGVASAQDVAMPLNGPAGVEPRDGSPAGRHTIVFRFSHSVVSGSATVSAGTALVDEAATFSGNTMTVTLTGVTNAQQITVALSNVTDALGQTVPTTAVNMKFLSGDVNGDSSVNSGDALVTRNRSGQTIDQTNFRSDINTDGAINGGDATLVRSASGTSVFAGEP